MKTDEEVLLEQLTEELRQARNESPTQNRKPNEIFFKLNCLLCFSSNNKTYMQADDSNNSLKIWFIESNLPFNRCITQIISQLCSYS